MNAYGVPTMKASNDEGQHSKEGAASVNVFFPRLHSIDFYFGLDMISF